MKLVYPVIISKGEKYLLAWVPDCCIDTQGRDMVNVIEMARDAISIWCVAEQDAGRKLPDASDLKNISCEDGEIATLVDVDIDAYRRRLDNKVVRKNLTLPSWLNEQAEAANINFSQLLQRAIKQELELSS